MKSIMKTKNDKKLTYIVLFLIIFPMTAFFFGFSNYLSGISNNSVDVIKEILLHEQAVNDGIASIASISTIPEMQLQKAPTTFSGVLYRNEKFTPQSYQKLKAVSIIEDYVSMEILENRYYSSPKYGFLYFFNSSKYKKLKPEMYSDVLSLTGNFLRFVFNRNYRVGFWNNHLLLNEIYKDTATKKMIITIASPVLNITTKKTNGFIYNDISKSQLLNLVCQKIKVPSWLNISAKNVSQKRMGDLCITKECYNGFWSVKLMSRSFADIFIIESRVNIKSYIADNQTLLILTLSGFVLLFFIFSKITHLIIKFQQKIVIDPLTRVYNRQIIGYLSPSNYNSLILFDCDNFKKINDTYGHVAGDESLKHVANTISNNIRNEDVAIRYGGDEFIVLCTMDECWASQVAERICSKLSESQLEFGQDRLTLSLSFGVANVSDDFKLSLNSADRFMYTQKAGKRQV